MNRHTNSARRRPFSAQPTISSRWPEHIAMEIVSAPQATAMGVLEALLLRRTPPGPVVADFRGDAPRVGFVLSASNSPDRTALHDWVAQSGWRNGVRIAPHHASAVSKSVFRIPLGRLRWVIPPGGAAAQAWPVLALLAALTDATTTPDITRLRW